MANTNDAWTRDVYAYPWHLQYAPIEFKNNLVIVLHLVRMFGLVLQYASQELRATAHIVFAAVAQNGCALKFVNAELRDDFEVVGVAVRQNGNALKHASSRLRNDFETVLTAVRQNGHALKYASRKMQSDIRIVREAIDQSFCAMRFSRKTAKEIVSNCGSLFIKAFRKSGGSKLEILENIGSKLKTDKAFFLKLLWLDYKALNYADPTLLDNRDFILECAKINGRVLDILSPEMKNDKEIVMAAVFQTYYAMWYVPDSLKYDVDVMKCFVDSSLCDNDDDDGDDDD